MVRKLSACPRQVIAFGRRLAAGWAHWGGSIASFVPQMPGDGAPATAQVARGVAPSPAISPSGELPPGPVSALPVGNVRPARPERIQEGAAWLDLMAQISHDLRTPLNAVIGFSDVMSSELLGPVGHPRYREYATDIRDSGKRLLKAAEDTLAMTSLLTRPARESAQRINLGSLAHTVTLDMTSEFSHATVTIAEACHDIEIMAPAHPLRQALKNLLTEAFLRCPDRGSIVLSATPEDETVRLEIAVACAGPRPGSAPASLPMSLARALLDLQGAGLIELTERDGTWRAVTVLDLALQRDFFSAPSQASGWELSSAAYV